jgi:hypothetical protein
VHFASEISMKNDAETDPTAGSGQEHSANSPDRAPPRTRYCSIERAGVKIKALGERPLPPSGAVGVILAAIFYDRLNHKDRNIADIARDPGDRLLNRQAGLRQSQISQLVFAQNRVEELPHHPRIFFGKFDGHAILEACSASDWELGPQE